MKRANNTKLTNVFFRTAKFMRYAIVLVKCTLEENEEAAMITLSETKEALAAIDKAMKSARESGAREIALHRSTLETAKCCVAWTDKNTLLYFNDANAMAQKQKVFAAWETVA